MRANGVNILTSSREIKKKNKKRWKQEKDQEPDVYQRCPIALGKFPNGGFEDVVFGTVEQQAAEAKSVFK